MIFDAEEREALLLVAFDAAIEELESDGNHLEAEQIRDARALTVAAFDQHRAWMKEYGDAEDSH